MRLSLGWVAVSLPDSPELWRAQLRCRVAARIGGSLALPLPSYGLEGEVRLNSGEPSYVSLFAER